MGHGVRSRVDVRPPGPDGYRPSWWQVSFGCMAAGLKESATRSGNAAYGRGEVLHTRLHRLRCLGMQV